MKAFAQSLQVLISSPTKQSSRNPNKSANSNATKDGVRARRSKSHGGNGYSPVSPIELGSPLYSGSTSTDSFSTPTTVESQMMGVWGRRQVEVDGGLTDAVMVNHGSPKDDRLDPLIKSDRQHLAVGRDVSDKHRSDHHDNVTVNGRLAPEGSVRSETTIAEGSSNKENDSHAHLATRRDLGPAGTAENLVGGQDQSKSLEDGYRGERIDSLPTGQQGDRKTERRPLGSITPPIPSSPLVVIDYGETEDDGPSQACSYGNRAHEQPGPTSPPYGKDRTPKRSNTIGRSVKVEGRMGKRSIRDKFGLASALRGKSLGKGYKGRNTPSTALSEKDQGVPKPVPFPSSDNALHVPHRPPPLEPGSTFKRYPSQMSLVVPDVPTPMCAWPTPKMDGDGTGEVDTRSSLGSGGTIRGLREDRTDEPNRLHSIDHDRPGSTIHLYSLLPTRTRASDDPANAAVRSASRVEIRRVHSKRVKLENLSIPGQGETRGRVVSSTAIYDSGEIGTAGSVTQDVARMGAQLSQTQLLSPSRITTEKGSLQTSPRSFDSSQPFREETRASAIFFTPPGIGPSAKADLEASRFIKGDPTLERGRDGRDPAQARRRSCSLPSDLIRELEDQNEEPHHTGAEFRSPLHSTSSTPPPVVRVHFPHDQHLNDGGDLYSPPPRSSSKVFTTDSPEGRPRDISFSSQPKVDLGESLPDPYHSWPLLDVVPISITASQTVETISDDILRAMVAGMGVLSPMILSQFEFQVLVEAAHRLKVVIEELSKKHGTEIRRRRRALLYLQENIVRGELKQCQRVVKVISRMAETVDLDRQRLFIAQDQLRQVEALIGSHRERVLFAALSRCAKAQEGMAATLEEHKRELQKMKSVTSLTKPTSAEVRGADTSTPSPHLSSFTPTPNSKRKTSVRFQQGPTISYRSSVRRGAKRASIRSQPGERGSTQSALSVDDWSIYKFPLPPSTKPTRADLEETFKDKVKLKDVSVADQRTRHNARVSSVDILVFSPCIPWDRSTARDFPESPNSDEAFRIRRTHSEADFELFKKSAWGQSVSGLAKLRPNVKADPYHSERRHSAMTLPHSKRVTMLALRNARPLSTQT